MELLDFGVSFSKTSNNNILIYSNGPEILDNKLDITKTTIICMQVSTKVTSCLGQFLMSVTRMVTHGHGDGACAQYSTCGQGTLIELSSPF